MPITVRTATATDVEAILALWRSAAENRGRPADSRAAIETVLSRDPDALIVAIDADLLVGTIIVGWDGWRCHLYRLAVDPEHRRTGIGGLLLQAAQERARAMGASRIDAMVLDDNALGQTIWLANGYDRQPDWRRWVKPADRR
jgi:ribosomal protein S18 acetylase RimI-like enzyme